MKLPAKFVNITLSLSILGSFSTSPAIADSIPRTQTTFTTTGLGGVEVIPYINGNNQIAYIDFQSADWSNIEYVYYNFTYNTTAQGTKRGVEGSFIPSQVTMNQYGGETYYRQMLLFGTCSKNVCTYDPNPTNVQITVNTNMISGSVDQYTTVLSITN